jgi:DNA-binding NarL/FixJ family response regulator
MFGFLTTFDDAELLLEAARRGARGFMSKDIPLEELLAAIRAVARIRNHLVFTPAPSSTFRV